MAQKRQPRTTIEERSRAARANARWRYDRQHRHLSALQAVADADGYASCKEIGACLYERGLGHWSKWVTADMLGRSAVSVLVGCRKDGLVVGVRRKGRMQYKLTAQGEPVARETFYAYENRLMADYRATREAEREAEIAARTAEDKKAPVDAPYVMENAGPLDEGEASYSPGDRVHVNEEHEMYPDEEGVVLGVGRGQGFYAGAIVIDVLIDGCELGERFREDEIWAA